MQVALALEVAQQVSFLNHNDVAPWNIILSRSKKPQTFDYLVGIREVYRVETQCIPVLVDYGRSSVVVDNEQYIWEKSYDTYTDCIMLLVTSLNCILKYQTLNAHENVKILELCRHTILDKVYCPVLNTMEDLVNHVSVSHKYAHLVFSNKGTLLQRTPKHFFSQVSRLHYTLPIQRVDEYMFTNEGKVISPVNLCLPDPSSLYGVYYAQRMSRLTGIPFSAPKERFSIPLLNLQEFIPSETSTDDRLVVHTPKFIDDNYLELIYNLKEMTCLDEKMIPYIEEWKYLLFNANHKAFLGLNRANIWRRK
jgi:hypothetical protein